MSTSRAYSAFPEFRDLILAIPRIPLKARSLLIKQCQAQYDVPAIPPEPRPTILRLLDDFPPVPAFDLHGTAPLFVPLRDFFRYYNVSVKHATQSSFILDLLRGLPVESSDAMAFKEGGWVKEIALCMDYRSPSVNFRPFFFHTQDQVHPNLPHNPINLMRIRNIFRAFRQRLIDNPPTWYPRWTHKNMSYSTRRCFEDSLPGASLKGIPIFGQDDWMRFYEETGIMLDGDIELRQTWTASQAKPRVYACNGGTSFRYSRHLQDFFTDLTGIFPPTNKISRLRPGRLYVPPLIPDAHYRIYDLTSFTSNCAEQRSFCDTLSEFMDGVQVYTVDEVEGLQSRDLGQMLREYCQYCVVNPTISLERAPEHLRQHFLRLPHGIASMLGVFGNLMTCTVAHYLIISPVTDAFDEDNTAGDDGLVLEFDYSAIYIDSAIHLIGDYEPSKTFDSREDGAICLKRPITQMGTQLLLGSSIIPPTLVTAMTYLSGREVDSRYTHHGLEDLSLRKRVEIVGVDLMRFLRAAYRKGDPDDFPTVAGIYRGYRKIASGFLAPTSIDHFANREKILWPIDPESYDFFATDPYTIWCCYNIGEVEIDLIGKRTVMSHEVRLQGDEVVGNADQRLKLLETLGYVEIERITEHLNLEQSYAYLSEPLNVIHSMPVLRRIKCLKDVPVNFLFD